MRAGTGDGGESRQSRVAGAVGSSFLSLSFLTAFSLSLLPIVLSSELSIAAPRPAILAPLAVTLCLNRQEISGVLFHPAWNPLACVPELGSACCNSTPHRWN